MRREEYLTSSPEETKKIAEKLALTLHGGELIVAYGDLGCGKTAFCQGIGKALGVKRVINSPTFNLIKVYRGEKLSLYHVDCYRLENSPEEQKEIGLEEVVSDPNIITYVEWPDYGPKFLREQQGVIRLTITYLGQENRKIVIEDERF